MAIFDEAQVADASGEGAFCPYTRTGLAMMLAANRDEDFSSTFERISHSVADNSLYLYFDRLCVPCGYFILEKRENGDPDHGDDVYLTDIRAGPGLLRLMAGAVVTAGEELKGRIILPLNERYGTRALLRRLNGDRIRICHEAYADSQPSHDFSGAQLKSENDRRSTIIPTALPESRRFRKFGRLMGILLSELYSSGQFHGATTRQVRDFILPPIHLRQTRICALERGGHFVVIWAWLSEQIIRNNPKTTVYDLHPSDWTEGDNLCVLFATPRTDPATELHYQEWIDSVRPVTKSMYEYSKAESAFRQLDVET